MELQVMGQNERERRDRGGAPTIAAGEIPKLTGYAARFYDPADPGTEYRYKARRSDGSSIEIRERILPGAFDLAIVEDEVRGMYNHSQLLGRRRPQRESNTLELRSDDKGLWYEVQLADTAAGRDVRIGLGRGDITGSSFVFRGRPDGISVRMEGDYIVRELRSLFLLDVSAVDYPAYEGTSAELRSLDKVPADLAALLQASQAPEKRSESDPLLAELAAALQRPEGRGSDTISQNEIQYQLSQLLTTALGSWTWPSEVYDTFCVYEFGKTTWKQDYTINGFEVALSGKPQAVYHADNYVAREV